MVGMIVAQVPQEQIHHQGNQDHRLDQGLDHTADRHLGEGRGVVGEFHHHAIGHEGLELGEFFLDQGRNFEREIGRASCRERV